MANDWRTCTLGEVVELKRGFDLPGHKRKPGPIPLVSSSGVTDHIDTPMAAGPGVVTGRYGTIGEVFYIPTDFWPLNTTHFVNDFKGNDPRFISYLLQQLQFRAYSDKAAVPGLNRNHLHTAPVSIPSDSREQRAIAAILGAFDDKIDLNRRMCETLEAIARALFKSWFVDFDPVRAKAAGRDPGLPKPLADLFPASLENSELGPIPAGWQAGPLGDIAANPRRLFDPSAQGAALPYIGLEHMPKRSIAVPGWGSSAALASQKFEFRRGEILFGKLRPYFHKVAIAPVDGVCSTDILVISPSQPHWYGLLAGTASSDEFVAYTNAGSTGTRMPRTSWAEMARYPLAQPPAEIAREFSVHFTTKSERITAATHESRTLASIRDTLLPKLISGEIRVKEAEKAAAAAL
jgi:type I restriction enzyme S subunit